MSTIILEMGKHGNKTDNYIPRKMMWKYLQSQKNMKYMTNRNNKCKKNKKKREGLK